MRNIALLLSTGLLAISTAAVGSETLRRDNAEDFIRAQIKVEVANLLSNPSVWDILPNSTRDMLRPFVNLATPMGN